MTTVSWMSAHKLEMGLVWINDSIVYVGAPQMPYGGVKQGGFEMNLAGE